MAEYNFKHIRPDEFLLHLFLLAFRVYLTLLVNLSRGNKNVVLVKHMIQAAKVGNNPTEDVAKRLPGNPRP